MKYLSERVTDYIVKSGAISEESYEVYQYGFQIGLEMLSCFLACFGIAVYLHMIPEFVILTGVFMLLRTYAGGLHLNSYGACFVCSVVVQTSVLVIHSSYKLPIIYAVSILGICMVLIWKAAPVETINRELDSQEKVHCKKITTFVLVGIVIFAVGCILAGADEYVSLLSVVVFVIMVFQYIGIIKNKIEKKKIERRS